ncbi:histidine utilization repressor [Halomonas sp. DP5N14-9]|uniref:Histidine utilization repressor n=1 Tax=Halomonas sp. H10-59 TaxID=2950874 RepID=A0AAU7L0F0_9GAMM|nr:MULTISPECIES: histidine utilization repressor [unclassified Halomonas]MBR9770714.1 histidine utilization repressor [Gammaproteobacteria bacterium]MBR9879098.1 histidine utilization repressor [Gammaproteobacteria bacterium]MBY5941419.1 histidine utilization repressor [Halomonas sp. DP5N14-9]MBY6111984.1 histidine utilization repressor [Halomonas sp. DP1Y21-3]USZ51682.1 histidine utilization repressor [Halomonas sp. DN3]
MARPAPRYLEIQQHILAKIQRGEWPTDHRIPGEEQLALDFNVSRMTANKAIRELVQRGYLTRQPGAGTFVTERKAESSLMEVHNIAEEVRGRGHHYRARVQRAEAIDASEDIALQLGVKRGSKVFHTRIVHHENDEPIQLEMRYVNPRHVPDYLDADFTLTTPHQVLIQTWPITDIEHVVEAVSADTQQAEELAISTSLPCLQLRRRTWSNDLLISYAVLIHPGDRYKLRSAWKD